MIWTTKSVKRGRRHLVATALVVMAGVAIGPSEAVADDPPISEACKAVMSDAALTIWTLQEIGPRWALERARFSLTQGKAGVRKQNEPGYFMCSADDTHRRGFSDIQADFAAKEAIIVAGEKRAGLKFVKADWGPLSGVPASQSDFKMQVHYVDASTNHEVSEQEVRSRLKWNEHPLRSWPTGSAGGDGAAASAAGAPAAFAATPGQHAGTHAMPFRAGSTWVGDYMCGDTKGALRITIDHVQGTHVDATTEFRVASLEGSYHVSGDYLLKLQAIAFRPGAWIHQPQGVNAIELDGAVSHDLRAFSGHVNAPGCSSFATKL